MYALNLTPEEFHAMRQLIDIGIKSVGLGAVTSETLAIRQMIETAQPVETPTEEPAA